ncbi:hydroxyacylglutathione hydrolase [Pseudomonas sp. AN-1]|jgi:hydroxyacylglutathione hydrolase|uniref:hydroxyacylglutathione hydrolase n=1 Tax=Pseudomonas sp. AN-1 TaxID=3096605 RepID=UPI002A6B111A|nr:hydroxyacylglutathione hydrolase [Pseudomonas sp. AN-1]WPP47285.1 hydroxyacylglutathione hydrolase [Pseudomonas sp. AN-1]
MIQITALPAFSDNYIWLLQDPARQRCAAVDPGDSAPVLAWLAAHPDWLLTDILVTHHHQDHTGGVLELKARTGARVLGPALEAIPCRDVALEDSQRIDVLGLEWQVLHVPGHTAGHVALFTEGAGQPVLLCGDTLFAAGCGRLFEGTAAQMHASLQRLASLPGPTRVYCTHEYTLANLRFALAVEPDNQALQQRQREAAALRERDLPTLPSTLSLELATNPFLRANEPAVRKSCAEHAGSAPTTAETAFAALRVWKDNFR